MKNGERERERERERMGTAALHGWVNFGLFYKKINGFLFTGTGHVCCTYFDASPYSIDIVRMFNFNDEICTR